MSVKRICEVIMRGNQYYPISHMIHGIYDIDGVSLSMPAIVVQMVLSQTYLLI